MYCKKPWGFRDAHAAEEWSGLDDAAWADLRSL